MNRSTGGSTGGSLIEAGRGRIQNSKPGKPADVIPWIFRPAPVLGVLSGLAAAAAAAVVLLLTFASREGEQAGGSPGGPASGSFAAPAVLTVVDEEEIEDITYVDDIVAVNDVTRLDDQQILDLLF